MNDAPDDPDVDPSNPYNFVPGTELAEDGWPVELHAVGYPPGVYPHTGNIPEADPSKDEETWSEELWDGIQIPVFLNPRQMLMLPGPDRDRAWFEWAYAHANDGQADVPEHPPPVPPGYKRPPPEKRPTMSDRVRGLCEGVSKGQRNDAAAALAGYYIRLELSDLELPIMIDAWNEQNNPPLGGTELRRVINSIQGRDKRQKAKGKAEAKGKESQATQLVEIAMESCRLFRDQAGAGFAEIEMGSHVECYEISSTEFRDWLTYGLYERAKVVPTKQAVEQARAVLTYQSRSAPIEAVFVRCGECDGLIYYDLCDPDWRAVEIRPGGWKIVGQYPVHFRRYSHMLPQVEPVQGGSLGPVMDLLNLSSDADRMLMKVYLASLFLTDIDHLICCFLGPQGSGKSQGASIVGRVVDPSGAQLLRPPKNERDVPLLFQHHWVTFFDNLTKVSDGLLDEMCAACTDIGQAKRSLYTDDGERIYRYRRVIGLTAISCPFLLRPDALDRSFFVRMEPISNAQRKTRAEIEESLEAALPGAVGACLDAVARALEIYPTVKPKESPRMADFYAWGIAIAEGLGYEPGEWEAAYLHHVEMLDITSTEQDVVALMVRELTESEASKGKTAWEGRMTELHKELERYADALDIDKYTREWPSTANWLASRLDKAEAGLLKMGIRLARKLDSATRRSRIRITWSDGLGAEEPVANDGSGEPEKPSKSLKVNLDKLSRAQRRRKEQ